METYTIKTGWVGTCRFRQVCTIVAANLGGLTHPYQYWTQTMTSESTQKHRRDAARSICVSILTVSDTRTLDNDLGGKLIEDMLLAAGHLVQLREIVADETDQIRSAAARLLASPECEAVLVTGGTGLAARDCTPEAVESLYDAVIPGYGELFRMLSFSEIGSASMLSRASGGRVGKKVILTMPGSPAGVRLAMERLIVPELAHLVHHAGK
jgi:molybdenum cofactor biosynthesis protein B